MILIEIQAEDPATLPPNNLLSMIARLEQAPTAAALEELARSLPDWFTRIRLPGAARDSPVFSTNSQARPEVPDIVKLIFECETAEEFLRRMRDV